MIEIYSKQGISKIYRSPHSIPTEISDFLSIQLIGNKADELQWATDVFKIDLSILKNGEDIEISSHYQEKNGQLSFHFSLPYLDKLGKMIEEPLFFVASNGRLFSFLSQSMEDNMSQLASFRQNVHQINVDNLKDLLSSTIEIVVDYYADLTELITKRIKVIAERLLKKKVFSDDDLDTITDLNFNNIQIKESLIEFQRVLSLFKKSKQYNDESFIEKISDELNDLFVVSDHIQYNFDRLDDLRENVTIKINLEQNNIFKKLTIVTVCIAMPTLVAGVYGMNFEKMPELKWHLGYPFSLVLMLLSIVFPILFFKKKKWF